MPASGSRFSGPKLSPGQALSLLWLLGLLAIFLYQVRSLLFHSPWSYLFRSLGQALHSLPSFLVRIDSGALWIVPLALSGYGLGRAILGRLFKFELPAGPTLALGLGALALLSYFLAGFGWAAATVRGTLGVLGIYGLLEFTLSLRFFTFKLKSISPTGWAVGMAVAFAGLVVSLSLLQPTVFYDALFYHLALPRSYLLTGDTAPLPFNACSYYPQNLEMLYLLGLSAGGVLAAQLVNALVWFTVVWLGRDLGRQLLGPEAGVWAALALALTPTLSQGSILIMNDGATAMFGLAGLWCLVQIAESPDRRYWWLWGAALGLAGGTKYSAYLFVILPQVLVLLFSRSRSFAGLFRAGLVAAALLFPWWLRNFLAVGNPLFPALAGVIGDSVDPLLVQAFRADGHAVALSPRLLPDLWRLPQQLFGLAPQHLDLAQGAASLLGPMILLGFPFLFPARTWSRGLKLVLVSLLLAVIFWFGSFRMIRYLQPALAAAAVLSGLGLARLRQRLAGAPLPRRAATALLLAFALSGLAVIMAYGLNLTLGFYCVRQRGSAADYLTRRSRDRVIEMGSFPLILRLNQTLPAEARLLFVGETSFFYLKRPCLAPASMNPNPLAHLIRQGLPFPAIAGRLREAGLTHVLYRPDEFDRLEQTYRVNHFSPGDRERLDQFFASGLCSPISVQDRPRVLICELQRK